MFKTTLIHFFFIVQCLTSLHPDMNSSMYYRPTYFPAENLTEYKWPPDDTGEYYMLQEQVSEYLGVTSFKRKYPGITKNCILHTYITLFPAPEWCYMEWLISTVCIVMFNGAFTPTSFSADQTYIFCSFSSVCCNQFEHSTHTQVHNKTTEIWSSTNQELCLHPS